jgi:hypothetical protein
LWFLNAAVEFRLDLDVLVSPDMEMALNRRSHGLSEDGVLRTLLELQRRGWISFRSQDDDVRGPGEAVLRDALHARERGLRMRRLWYGLTESGGAAWEAEARPLWDRFIGSWVSGDWQVKEPREEETLAASRERILGFAAFANDWEPVADTQCWDDVIPWQATYWKTLPRGVRLRQRVRHVPFGERVALAGGIVAWRRLMAECEAYRRWHRLV